MKTFTEIVRPLARPALTASWLGGGAGGAVTRVPPCCRGGARLLGSGGGIELGVGRPLPRPRVRGRWGRKGRVDREVVDDGESDSESEMA
jgi:hypothetical protein